MEKIKYDPKEEAYEIKYKIWEKDVTVRFYVEEQQEIMDNFKDIAHQLDKLNLSKEAVSKLIVNENKYRGFSDTLIENIEVLKAYIDIDDEGSVLCFTVSSKDGCLAPLAMELFEDEFEVIDFEE